MTETFEPASAPPEAIDRLRRRFAHVDVWVFDLDNTLYPPDSDLWPKIDQRITLFLAEMFGIDGLSARALQKYYYERYGTTLKGLVEEQKVSADDFLAFVHDIDRSSVKPDHSLAAAIGKLPGRKLILTNGSRQHALATARSLGLDKAFEDVFDIVAANLVPKPEAVTYETFFAKHHVDPTRAAMFEDYPKNLIVPHRRGMATTLVAPRPGQLDHRGDFRDEEARGPQVDYVTHDLTGFLEAITPD